MRKRYRTPGGRTCKLCHPEKVGWERRWKAKEEARLHAFEEWRTRSRWLDWREELAADEN